MSIHSETLNSTEHLHTRSNSPFSYWISREKTHEKSIHELDREYEMLKEEFRNLYGDERTLYEPNYATNYFYNFPSLNSEHMDPYKSQSVMSKINYSHLIKIKGKRFARSILFSSSTGEHTREHHENKKIMKILAGFVTEPWIYLKRDYLNKYHPKFLKFLCNTEVPRRTPTISKYFYVIFKYLYVERYRTDLPSRLKNELKNILNIRRLGLKKKLELEEAGVISRGKPSDILKTQSKTVVDEARTVLRKMALMLPPHVSIRDLVLGVDKVASRYKINLKGFSYEPEALAFFTLLHFLKGFPLPSRPTLISLLLDLPKKDFSVIQTYRKIFHFGENNPYLSELISASNFTKLSIDDLYLEWQKVSYEPFEIKDKTTCIQKKVSVSDCQLLEATDAANELALHGMDWLPTEVLSQLFNSSDTMEFLKTVSHIENLGVQKRFNSLYRSSVRQNFSHIQPSSLPVQLIKIIKGVESLTFFSQGPDLDIAFLSFVRHFVDTEEALVFSRKFTPKFLKSFFPPLLVNPIIKNMVFEIPSHTSRMVILLDECTNHEAHPPRSLCRKINRSPELVVSYQLVNRIRKGIFPPQFSEINAEMNSGRMVIVEQRNPMLEKLSIPFYGRVPWRTSSLLIDMAYYVLIFGSKGGKVLLNPNFPSGTFFNQYLNGTLSYRLNQLMTSENLNPMQLAIGDDEVIAFYLLQIIQLRLLQKKYCASTNQNLPPIFWLASETEFAEQLLVCGLKNPERVRKRLGIHLLDPDPLTSITDFLTLFNAFLTPLPKGSTVVFPSIHRILQDEYVPDELRKMDDDEYYSYLWELAESEVSEFDETIDEFIQKELDAYIDETTTERELLLLRKEAEEKFQMKRQKLIQSIDAKIKAAVITRSHHQDRGIPYYFNGNYSTETKVRLFQLLQNVAEKAITEEIFILMGCRSGSYFKIPIEKFVSDPGSFLPTYNLQNNNGESLESKERFMYHTEQLFLDVVQLQKDLLSKLPTYSFIHLSSHKDRVIAYLKNQGNWKGEIWNMGEVYRYLRRLEE
ncbi:MAG: hypothetical protein D6732_04105 [Methanobacteriota archaeon]|nr:MAG: hypothetical protein D6732_04105 [Euryarchaeota archaeon]